jgi:hypothetical protein
MCLSRNFSYITCYCEEEAFATTWQSHNYISPYVIVIFYQHGTGIATSDYLLAMTVNEGHISFRAAKPSKESLLWCV